MSDRGHLLCLLVHADRVVQCAERYIEKNDALDDARDCGTDNDVYKADNAVFDAFRALLAAIEGYQKHRPEIINKPGGR